MVEIDDSDSDHASKRTRLAFIFFFFSLETAADEEMETDGGNHLPLRTSLEPLRNIGVDTHFSV